jgi:hypothetical protein
MPKVAPRADNSLAQALRSYQLLEWYMSLDEELDPLGIGVERGGSAVRRSHETFYECRKVRS